MAFRKPYLLSLLSLFLCVTFVLPQSASAEFSDAQIRKLVEPIALYPDPLLFQMLPAATFPDEIVDAGLLIKSEADAKKIEAQGWDDSVKAIAGYPGVLKKMNEDLQWTKNLGEAFLNQDEQLLNAIQSLRGKAQDLGNLETNKQQTVKTEQAPSGDNVIIIEPSDPEVIYVPTNTTTVVYSEPNYSSSSALVPLATFGLGLAIGSAINDDHYYYYGGGHHHYWYDRHYHDRWQDRRWDHIDDRREYRQDRFKDQQDFRNDRVKDKQDFRQDRIKQGQDFRQDQARSGKGNFSRVSTLNQDNWNKARSDLQERRKASGLSTGTDRGWDKNTARNKVNSASGSRAQSVRSSDKYKSARSSGNWSSKRSAFKSSGSKQQVARNRSRGFSSRGNSSFSRSGGGRSFSRGGGGRSFGGRRR